MEKNEKIEIVNKLKKQALEQLVKISDYLSGNVTLGFIINDKEFCGLDVNSIDKCVADLNEVLRYPNTNVPYFTISAGTIDNGIYSRHSDMLSFEIQKWLD